MNRGKKGEVLFNRHFSLLIFTGLPDFLESSRKGGKTLLSQGLQR